MRRGGATGGFRRRLRVASAHLHHLSPAGMAGHVLVNGATSSDPSGVGEIRRNLVEADLVDCMVAMPGHVFYATRIPICP